MISPGKIKLLLYVVQAMHVFISHLLTPWPCWDPVKLWGRTEWVAIPFSTQGSNPALHRDQISSTAGVFFPEPSNSSNSGYSSWIFGVHFKAGSSSALTLTDTDADESLNARLPTPEKVIPWNMNHCLTI